MVSFCLKLDFMLNSTCVNLPRWCSSKESACQCRRCKRLWFYSWVEKIPWRKKWQPPLIFLPGKFHGQRRLVGYGSWGCKESDMTEHTCTDADKETLYLIPCVLLSWGIYLLKRLSIVNYIFINFDLRDSTGVYFKI